MMVFVDCWQFCGDKEGIISSGTHMPQERWPYITTSVSGIAADDWTFFKARARKERLTYRKALDQAVADLVLAEREGQSITWYPAKKAPSRPVKIHDDRHKEVEHLAKKYNYGHNVIIGTAMHRWATKL
jgi:hypothetical protein